MLSICYVKQIQHDKNYQNLCFAIQIEMKSNYILTWSPNNLTYPISLPSPSRELFLRYEGEIGLVRSQSGNPTPLLLVGKPDWIGSTPSSFGSLQKREDQCIIRYLSLYQVSSMSHTYILLWEGKLSTSLQYRCQHQNICIR